MSRFLVIPAIDLMSGQCVRLRQGRAEDRTVYSNDAAGVAGRFEEAGARRIHIVDLDGAFRGGRENLEAVRAIRRTVSCEIEVGGGFRTPQAVRTALEEGIDYVILGTLAVEQPGVLQGIVQEHGRRIVVALDARGGIVSVRGWVTEGGGVPVLDLAHRMSEIGVETFLHTDIARDGMLTGPNVEATRRLAEATSALVIASGGVGSPGDLHELASLRLPNLLGAIIGRALYDGRVDLAEAIGAVQR
jgi:phosphoribosylformimino-5-aminoimidazole carboxamide ribotide isomerase